MRPLQARLRQPGDPAPDPQIAMDGSQKLPQRILGTLSETFCAGREAPGLVLAVAAWMRYVGGVDEAGRPIEVKDPLADRLRALSEGADTPEGKVRALLSVREVFDPEIAAALAPRAIAAYRTLLDAGARAAAAAIAWRSRPRILPGRGARADPAQGGFRRFIRDLTVGSPVGILSVFRRRRTC